MDQRTIEYYSVHAKDASERFNAAKGEGVSRYFYDSFPRGASVLDIGCGSGRDMAILNSLGYDVYGVDPSPEMVENALITYPVLADRIIVSSVPADRLYFSRTFDCILCSAVLMHIPDELMYDSAFTMRKSLRENGTMLISVPLKRPDVGSDSRDTDGRLFRMRPTGFYNGLFCQLGFKIVTHYHDCDSSGRSGIEWGTLVYRIAGGVAC